MAKVDIFQMEDKETGHMVAPMTIYDAVVNPINKKTLDAEISELGSRNWLPILLDSYSNSLSNANYVGDGIIPNGVFVDKVKFEATGSNSGYVYLFRTSDKACVYKKRIEYYAGVNEVSIGFETEDDCFFGIRALSLLYSNSSSIPGESVFSMGLSSFTPDNPNVGDVASFSNRYSGKFALSISVSYIDGLLKRTQLVEEATQNNTENIADIVNAIGFENVTPTLLDSYANDLTEANYIGAFEIAEKSYVDKIVFYARYNNSGYVYLFRKSDNVCVYRKRVEYKEGYNEIEVGYETDNTCLLGVRALGLRYSNGSSIPEESVFSEGLHSFLPADPQVGESITTSKSFSDNFALSVSVVVNAGFYKSIGEVNKKVDRMESQFPEIDNRIGSVNVVPAPLESYSDKLTDANYAGSFVIPKGMVIDKVVFDATESSSGMFYFFRKSDNICVYRKYISFNEGVNEIKVGYKTEEDCYLGVRALKLKYYAKTSLSDENLYSDGLVNFLPADPSVGEAVSLTTSLQGRYALSIYVRYSNGISSDLVGLDNKIDESNERVSEVEGLVGYEKTFPSMLETYAYPLSDANYVGDFEIPEGAYINNVTFNARSSHHGMIFLFRKSDNVCVYFKNVNYNAGKNVINIGYTTEAACVLGVRALGLEYTNGGAVSDDVLFSDGLYTFLPPEPAIGEAAEFSRTIAGRFALSVSVSYGSGFSSVIKRVEEQMSGVQPTKIYPHNAIVSFIDDDCGRYIPSIWGEIISATPIRMGFACVTGIMAGEVSPPEVYTPISKQELEQLYNDGHEVYSHSYSHPAFYSSDTTVDNVVSECQKSKDWLLKNGFFRGSDVIVYPGGLGQTQTAKQDAVRQFFAYGVDTVGHTYNPEPLNPWCVYRINADTSTIEELKKAVDDAVAAKGLLVFMNHAYELNKDKTNQVAKMIELINYIKSTNAEILPFGEAIHRIYGW